MVAKNKVYSLAVSALLCAIGIILPVISPIKIILEPASFTLASHVVIFIAMFISPATAISVAFGTTIGFFLAGFPIVVVARASTHVIFALCGALILRKNPFILNKRISAFIFSFCIGLLHAVCEVIAVMPFYFGNHMSQAYYAKGFFTSIFLLVGIGTVIHSMIDFEIALFIWKIVKSNLKFHPVNGN